MSRRSKSVWIGAWIISVAAGPAYAWQAPVAKARRAAPVVQNANGARRLPARPSVIPDSPPEVAPSRSGSVDVPARSGSVDVPVRSGGAGTEMAAEESGTADRDLALPEGPTAPVPPRIDAAARRAAAAKSPAVRPTYRPDPSGAKEKKGDPEGSPQGGANGTAAPDQESDGDGGEYSGEGEKNGRAAAADQDNAGLSTAEKPDADAQADERDKVGAIAASPLSIDGIRVGEATIEELKQRWGTPVADHLKGGAGTASFAVEPFERVDAVVLEDALQSLSLHLSQAVEAEEAAKMLGLEGIAPVEVADDADQPLGLAYPERGALFSFVPGTRTVAQVLLEAIDLESFVLRAETTLKTQPSQALKDLEFVLGRQPQHARAHAAAARLCMDLGKYREARRHVDEALKVEARNTQFRLTKCGLLIETGDFAAAGRICRPMCDDEAIAPELRAQAHCYAAELLAWGPQRDFRQALGYRLRAIQLSEKLVGDPRAAVRRTAKRVLMEANLGAANDIAWGQWQQKERIAPKWLARGSEWADDLVKKEREDEAIRLLVLRKSLAASAGMQGALDPVAWAKETLQTGRRLAAASQDPQRRRCLEREMGLALYDSLQADQARGYHDHALANSALVVKYLEQAIKDREPTPHDEYVLGRLYFRIGAIHAIDREDHEAALAWFDKAAPLLERPLPPMAAGDAARHGEAFVSMGISYWEAGQREEGLRLTKLGVDWIDQAVRGKTANEQALAIPYANLASMHRELGNPTVASRFEQMAERVEGKATVR